MEDGRWTAALMEDGGWTAALMEDGGWTAALMEDEGWTAALMEDGRWTAFHKNYQIPILGSRFSVLNADGGWIFEIYLNPSMEWREDYKPLILPKEN